MAVTQARIHYGKSADARIGVEEISEDDISAAESEGFSVSLDEFHVGDSWAFKTGIFLAPEQYLAGWIRKIHDHQQQDVSWAVASRG